MSDQPPSWWPDGETPPEPDIGLAPDADGRYHWDPDGTGPQPSEEWREWRYWTHWAILPEAIGELTPEQLKRYQPLGRPFTKEEMRERGLMPNPAPPPVPQEPNDPLLDDTEWFFPQEPDDLPTI